MKNSTNFFINGEWVKPKSESKFEVINPASEEVVCHITLGNQLDLDSAVYAAKQGFGVQLSQLKAMPGEKIPVTGIHIKMPLKEIPQLIKGLQNVYKAKTNIQLGDDD